MTHALNHNRWIAGLLATALAVTTLTPAAEAGHGKWRRYKGEFRGSRSSYAPQRVIVRERSSAGPLIAGLIGGVVLGTAIANASHSDGYYSRAEVGYVREDDGCDRRGYGYSRARFAPPPRYRYSYYDPYCGQRFQSLDLCGAHYRGGCDHPRVVMMIDVRSGSCVQRYRYSRGAWEDYDDAGWDGNGYDHEQGNWGDDD